MSAHTPGPWETSVNSDLEWDVCTEGGGDMITALSDENAEGNACLIAAAPDLLAVVERYVASQDPCVRGDGTCKDDDGCVACELTAAARAAIAKTVPR